MTEVFEVRQSQSGAAEEQILLGQARDPRIQWN